ncbi:D-2-hydroxyacid dehydrogenase [Halomarina litorea]|uniref:D-2-hydroxyacid dehydrogenase n=1 Tax=Halomarina litorea TaxID=2961595 RepID=UPI0020C2F7A5|nr:D-2-hydroxyacid dehydrogenase [Halomarina sp. BCD28]
MTTSGTRIAVHSSVEPVFDPQYLVDALAERGVESQTTDDPAGFDGVVAFDHDESFLDAPWVHAITAGYDDYPVESYREYGVTFTNSTGIHGESVGETVCGMCLAFARRLHRYRDRQRGSEWDREPYEAAFTLGGERACVVGLGTLGRGVATRLDALGMDVVGVRRTPTPVPGVREVYTPDELHEAVSDARFVVLTVPLTAETRGMVGEAELDAMPADSYLVNVARGEVVEQSALVAALESGSIAGAGLDALDPEPLPEDSPLWGMDEVLLTPHVAAMTNDYHEAVADLVATNADRLAGGEGPVNRVV